jgi:hypothetical protein
MTNKVLRSMNRILVTLLTFALTFPMATKAQSTPPTCPRDGHSVYFVNGVANTSEDAFLSALQLSSAIIDSELFSEEQKANLKISYLYNPSVGPVGDIIEAARQLGAGLRAAVASALIQAMLAAAAGTDIRFQSVDYQQRLREAIRASILRQVSTSDVRKIVEDAAPRIEADVKARKQVTIVAHSQGNLFANDIYDELRLRLTPDELASIKVVNVAPPTTRIIDNLYILNASDTIISPPLSPFPTFRLDNFPVDGTPVQRFIDWTGHSFVATYLSTTPGLNSSNERETLRGQSMKAVAQAFSRGNSALDSSCESPGGFSNQTLNCRRNADGSVRISGLYAAALAPGEQITVAAWPTQYLSSTEGSCRTPIYDFPNNQSNGISAEYLTSSCSPTAGLILNPTFFATCYNPLGGETRNIWISLNANASSRLE